MLAAGFLLRRVRIARTRSAPPRKAGNGEIVRYANGLVLMDWTEAAASELDRLQGLQHEHKRRNTILAMVDARLAGRSEETVWTVPGTCARSTWHETWKRDPLMLDVLASVERTARRWSDTKTLRALAEAAERLQLASPAAAGKAIALMLSNDDRVALQAAFGVLDRAGVETAPKQQAQHGLTPELESLIERVYGGSDLVDGSDETDG